MRDAGWRRALLLGLLPMGFAGGCGEAACTELGIVREMRYEAVLPPGLDPSLITLELCFGSACDTSRLVASDNPNVGGLRCDDLDTHTPTFPTECTFVESERKLLLTTNTVYGGHLGSDPLRLTAVEASGARTILLHGTVAYEDTTDEGARAACTEAWKGTFRTE